MTIGGDIMSETAETQHCYTIDGWMICNWKWYKGKPLYTKSGKNWKWFVGKNKLRRKQKETEPTKV